MASVSESNEIEAWKRFAKREQMQVAPYLKEMDETTYSVLKSRLAVALFGTPPELEKESETLSYTQYGRKEQDIVEKVATCVLMNQDKRAKRGNCVYSLVLIVGRKHSSTQDCFKTWILRIPGSSSLEEQFIDIGGRVYRKWKCYLDENTLPEATICYPLNGRYAGTNEDLAVGFAETPASGIGRKVLSGLDIASVVTGMAAAGLTTASLFVPMATPLVCAALGTSLFTGLYGTGRSIETLVDREQHGQTISFLDTEARSAWLGATLPVVGIAAGGASVLAATAPKLGITMSQAAKTAINVTNGANCFSHGMFFVHDVYGIIEHNYKGYTTTNAQIMQCIASALVFANTIVTTHQARVLLKSMPTETGQGVFEKLLLKLGKRKMKENGASVRHTNFLRNTNIFSLTAVAVKWGYFLLNIPVPISSAINDIIQFIEKSCTHEKITFEVFISGLCPLLIILWTHIFDHIQPENMFEKCCPGFQMCTEQNALKKSNTSNKKEQLSEIENFTEAPTMDKITIVDLDYGTNEVEVQKVIKTIPGIEKKTPLEILNITRLFLERVRKDVQQKENDFQNILKVSNITEKDLEIIYKIVGDRTQFFVNNVMESYTDFKLLAFTQDNERIQERSGIQIPLFDLPISTVKIKCYTSLQKEGTHEQKYHKILKQAGVDIHPSCIIYCAKNVYLVEFRDTNSEHILVGLVNFVEGEQMSGLIVLQKRTP